MKQHEKIVLVSNIQCFYMGMMLLLLPQVVLCSRKSTNAMRSNLWMCSVHSAFSKTGSSIISVGKGTDGNLGETHKLLGCQPEALLYGQKHQQVLLGRFRQYLGFPSEQQCLQKP